MDMTEKHYLGIVAVLAIGLFAVGENVALNPCWHLYLPLYAISIHPLNVHWLFAFLGRSSER